MMLGAVAAVVTGVASTTANANPMRARLADTLHAVPAPSAADRANVERLERDLADDSMEGRGTATPGGARAARFLATEMKNIGLKAGGDSGYFQRVPMMDPPAAAGGAGGNAGGRGRGRGAGGAGGARPTPPPTPDECLAKAPDDATMARIKTLQASIDAAAAKSVNTPIGPGHDGGGGPMRPRPVRLPSLADRDTVPADRQRTAVNVVGIIPGGDPVLKNEVVLVLSHYDHLGRVNDHQGCRPVGADSLCNGADDDRAGTVAVLEVARLLKKAGTPRRTIVFANMTGEEIGLVGTNYFIAHPPFPLAQIVAGFEIEMIGRPDAYAGGPGKAWLTGYERSTMGDMLKQYGIAIVPDMRPDQRFFMRSDNYGLAQRGIVAHTLSTFNLHSDYHYASDEVNKVDFDHMTAVIHSAAEAVRHLADGPKPEWHAGCNPAHPGE
jgi:hypothetical protein